MERFIKPWLPSPEEPNYTFINANVVDVVHDTILADTTVHVSNGRIQSITPGPTTTALQPYQVVDLDGKYLMPGLIDSHVHMSATPGESDPAKMLKPDENLSAFRIPYVAQDMLCRGFTTVRDCGGAPPSLKTALEEWAIIGPRLLTAGHALTQNGGHGDFRDRHDHSDPECPSCGHFVGLARVVNGVPEALHKTRDELRQGADFIKVMGSGGTEMLTGLAKTDQTQFSLDEMRAITSTAAAAGTYVTVHAYTTDSMRHAIAAGAKGIEHGNMLDRETARLMKADGVYLTPTLVTFAMMADGPAADMTSTAERDRCRKMLASGLQAIKIAQEEGVSICFGTDLLGPLGVFQTQEIALRKQVQSALEIIQSATITPAKMMGLEGEIGQVTEGFAADLLVLKSNPLEDIEVLNRSQTELLAVFRQGRACFSALEGVKGLLGSK